MPFLLQYKRCCPPRITASYGTSPMLRLHCDAIKGKRTTTLVPAVNVAHKILATPVISLIEEWICCIRQAILKRFYLYRARGQSALRCPSEGLLVSNAASRAHGAGCQGVAKAVITPQYAYSKPSIPSFAPKGAGGVETYSLARARYKDRWCQC
jgi:hypothetical protein